MSVTTAWAGLRSFAPDRQPVVGFAPDQPAFLWFAGQGGVGVQTSPALARAGAAIATVGALPGDLVDVGLTVADLAPTRRTLGLGVVLSGLSIGLTVGLLATPYLIGWGSGLGLGGEAWRAPLWVFGVVSLLVALATYLFFRSRGDRNIVSPSG